MTRRLRAVVRGRVQGVGFRDATARRAARLGVAGYVRNLADGTVEVVVEGDDAGVERMLAFLEEGPPAARVAGVDARAVRPRGEGGFTVR